MTQYYFRLRFYFPKHQSVNSDASTLEFAVPPEGNSLCLTPQDGDGTIRSARHMVLSGGPYADSDRAEDAGMRARHALIQYAIHSHVGIDLGKDQATGGLSKYAKDKIAQDTRIQIINDVHGLLVYAGGPNTKFIRGNPVTLILGRLETDFISRIQHAYSQDFQISNKERVAFELFSASQFELSTRSRFIILVMAIEALLQPSARETQAQDHVTRLIDLTAKSGLPDSEKTSMIGSLKWLYLESIGKTGKRLADKLLGDEKYADKTPAAFFTKCYTIRSQLVHNGTLSDDKTRLGSWVGELERFVADLLKASIRPVAACRRLAQGLDSPGGRLRSLQPTCYPYDSPTVTEDRKLFDRSSRQGNARKRLSSALYTVDIQRSCKYQYLRNILISHRNDMAHLRIGTCSWKYPSWQGLVYSAAKGINFLEEYAQRYQAVEIDQWFWSLFEGHPPRLPSRKDVIEYRQSVDDDFKFSFKVPNSITLTHYYKKRKTDPLVPNPYFLSPDLWRKFIGRIEPLKDCMGPLILQFEYLNKEKMKNQSDFHRRLGRFSNEITPTDNLAVETRNPRYLNSGFFDFLSQYKVSPVLMHGYWMPSIVDVYRRFRDKILSHKTVVIRLHGANRKDIEKLTGKRWDKIVAPMDDELGDIADLVGDLVDNGVNVYLNVNNHYEGSAPLTIERLSNLMDH